jgi:Reverse transcriptase (RNA-dependent DNA polymerase)
VRHARPPRGGGRHDEAIRFELAAKPGGSIRTLAMLGERDGHSFEHAVAAVVPAVERALTGNVMANRSSVVRAGLELEPWAIAWRRYVRSVSVAAEPSRVAFVGDVLDCYASITPTGVQRALVGMGAGADEAARVAQLLRSFEARGVRGLPVGPAGSAVLANAVLAPLDRAFAEAAGGPAFRWVDDVVAFAPGRVAAQRTADAFRRALDDLGLEAHPTKCAIVHDRSDLLSTASTASAGHGQRRGMMRRP